jgi:hypothetical protein
MSEETFRIRYVGARFQNARLPVDVLSDLPAFRDLLVAFAKDHWRDLHADKQRVPKGFDKSLSFDLIAIEPGSAMPAVNWNRENAQQLLPGFTDELEGIVKSSYNDITQLIDGAGYNRFPKTLGSVQVRALNRLGSGLRDDERIEFFGSTGTDGKVIYLDSVRRKQLITHVSETYLARLEGTGTLLANNLDGFIVVMTPQGQEIKIPLDAEQIKEEFDGCLESDIQFDLQGEFDNNDQLRQVVSVYDIRVIDAQLQAELSKCQSRLEDLEMLSSGWNNGEGDQIGATSVEVAARFISKRPSLCSQYKIYPTDAGGILIEFQANDWDLSIEFESDGSLEFYGIQVEDGDSFGPVLFTDINEEFFDLFDQRTGTST